MCIACACYHVWIDRHSYTIEADPTFKRRPTLYMNPPPNVFPGMASYFRTRKLDARKHGIVDAVLAPRQARRADRGRHRQGQSTRTRVI